MSKNILVFGGMLLALLFVFSPVSAETEGTLGTNPSPTLFTPPVNTSAKNPVVDVAAKIACVRSAVSVREAAMVSAVATHAEAIKAAHATRVNELDGAYSNTTTKAVQAGVKVAWADFNKSVKAATKAWKTNKNAAWATFRTAVKDCKAPSGVSDSGNSGSEVSGS